MEYKLGEEIEVETILERITEYSKVDENNLWSKRLKLWKPFPLEEKRKAIVVGIRNLSNGYTDFDAEAGNMYNPTEYFQAILVVSNLHNVPYFIPFQ